MGKGFIEGEEHYIWKFNHGNNQTCLADAELFACEHCGKPSSVNATWIMSFPKTKTGRAMREVATAQADSIQKKWGEITDLSMDDKGNCYCEECFYRCANERMGF